MSQNARSRHERQGFSPNHATVIQHGVDLPRPIRPRPLPSDRNKKILTIGTMAHFHPAKGYPILLAALAQVFKSIPNTRALLAGTGIKTQNSDLTALIRTADIDSARIELLGPIENRFAFFTNIDVFVVASTTEAGPIALFEAMAHGVPCISTDVGDARAMLGTTGETVRPGDSMTLARAIERLLRHPDRVVFGQEAAAHVQRNYSMSYMLERYQQELANLLASE